MPKLWTTIQKKTSPRMLSQRKIMQQLWTRVQNNVVHQTNTEAEVENQHQDTNTDSELHFKLLFLRLLAMEEETEINHLRDRVEDGIKTVFFQENREIKKTNVESIPRRR